MESVLRVDNHHLSQLTVRTGGTVEEHGLLRHHRHVEGSHGCLAILEGNVAAVEGAGNSLLEGLASLGLVRLRDGVIAVAELELDNIAHGSLDRVGHESDLLASHNNRDDLGGGGGVEGTLCRGWLEWCGWPGKGR